MFVWPSYNAETSFSLGGSHNCLKFADGPVELVSNGFGTKPTGSGQNTLIYYGNKTYHKGLKIKEKPPIFYFSFCLWGSEFTENDFFHSHGVQDFRLFKYIVI